MDNLHFLPNNILTKFFKELTKYKNDYISIVFKLYIYIGIILYILICTPSVPLCLSYLKSQTF